MPTVRQSLVILFFIAAVCKCENVGYVYQAYWYNTDQCLDSPSFLEAFQINTCIQTGQSQYIVYAYENASTTRNPFQVKLQYYNDVKCSNPSGPVTTATYQKTCSSVSRNAVSSYYMEGAPSLSYSGSLRSYFSSFKCVGYPTYIYWRSSDCAPVGHTSSSVSCTSDGSSYVYKTWHRNNTCHGNPSSSQNVAVVSSCQQYYSNSYSAESCTGLPAAEPQSRVSCFAGAETVFVEGAAGPVSIQAVRVGDRILATSAEGRMQFSPVIAVPHARNDRVAEFVRLETQSGRRLMLTPAHLLLADCSHADHDEPATPVLFSRYSLTAASGVETGCVVHTVDGAESVVDVRVVVDRGLYTVVTQAEYIVVSGIVASPFAVSHYLGRAYYSLTQSLKQQLLPLSAAASALFP